MARSYRLTYLKSEVNNAMPNFWEISAYDPVFW